MHNDVVGEKKKNRLPAELTTILIQVRVKIIKKRKPLSEASEDIIIFFSRDPPNLNKMNMSYKTANENLREQEKLPTVCYQEDALYHEHYPGQDKEGPYKTQEQKLQRLKQLDNQGLCPLGLTEVYPNIEMTGREELKKMEERIKLLKQFEKEIKNKKHCELEKPLDDVKKQEEEDNTTPEK